MSSDPVSSITIAASVTKARDKVKRKIARKVEPIEKKFGALERDLFLGGLDKSTKEVVTQFISQLEREANRK